MTSKSHWPNKVSPIERLHRQIRRYLGKLISAHTFKSVPDAIRRIETSINSRVHSSTNLIPNLTTNFHGPQILTSDMKRREKVLEKGPAPTLFKVGDLVRARRQRNVFEKTDIGVLSSSVYRVHSIKYTEPIPSYYLFDLELGVVVDGSFSQRALSAYVDHSE